VWQRKLGIVAITGPPNRRSSTRGFARYIGFLDKPVVFKAPDVLFSCASIGAAVKADGGLVGGETANQVAGAALVGSGDARAFAVPHERTCDAHHKRPRARRRSCPPPSIA
jgi:hypothetical protein